MEHWAVRERLRGAGVTLATIIRKYHAPRSHAAPEMTASSL
jgi:hypothetical protein